MYNHWQLLTPERCTGFLAIKYQFAMSHKIKLIYVALHKVLIKM